MKLLSGPNWEISCSEPEALVTALYIRDCANLTPVGDPVIPPLEPAVDVQYRLSPQDAELASSQWEDWWARLVAAAVTAGTDRIATPPGRIAIPSTDTMLGELIDSMSQQANSWVQQRRREFADYLHFSSPYAGVERKVLRSIRRRVGLFKRGELRFNIIELPVATSQGWQLNASTIMITRALRLDIPAYTDWLASVIGSRGW